MNYIDPEQLEANYYKKAKETVVVKLTEETRAELEHQYVEVSTKLKEKIDFIDSVKDLMNVDTDDVQALKDSLYELTEMSDLSEEGVKTLKKQADSLITSLKKGHYEKECIVYYMDDMLSGKMLIYLEDGTFHEERKLQPEEMQTKIKNIA